ncbi:CDP-alcohol phosphatidyltransferase family protein [Tessaracoccus sp. SD287]|uniref:CDP-alcohol phosphatidyltransferase family protein n=1 Tax=Tessaracoccus sp. SD287 TaxID=2782008 RepID=UPI001A968F2A|nr:CDP-alcohol phosphatidyltransferase family protein [Tessaracoccus sp. SD287]MBO1031378.1 CDP-alcohol phosphatidyltransferase family protein [Tessaracoccus sp. SD287]
MHNSNQRGFSDSLARLRYAQKSNKGAPLYSILVNRPVGRVLAAAAHKAGLTPNGVTIVSALFTFSGIAVIALARPSLGVGVLIAALLVLGYALDSADGQLARLRGGGSMLGEWLDHVIDSFKIATLHSAVLIMMVRHYDLARSWLLVPLAFGAVYVIHFFGMLLTELLARVAHAKAGVPMPPKGKGSTWVSLAKLPTDYGLLCWIFVLVGWPTIFLSVYAILGLMTAAYTALVLVTWARRVAALDRMG